MLAGIKDPGIILLIGMCVIGGIVIAKAAIAAWN